MTNIRVDWEVFESKFSQNPRAAFEGLSTTLFCNKMGLSHGIFRYFNHPYIETQPVTAPDGLLTGFQAKYYDASTRISSKEADFKNAIADAKQKYAGISRIIFLIRKCLTASAFIPRSPYIKRISKHTAKALASPLNGGGQAISSRYFWHYPQ